MVPQPLGVGRAGAAFVAVLCLTGAILAWIGVTVEGTWLSRITVAVSLLSTAAGFALRYFHAEVFQRPEPAGLEPIWRIMRSVLVLGVVMPLAILFVGATLNPTLLSMAQTKPRLTLAFALAFTALSFLAAIVLLRTVTQSFEKTHDRS